MKVFSILIVILTISHLSSKILQLGVCEIDTIKSLLTKNAKTMNYSDILKEKKPESFQNIAIKEFTIKFRASIVDYEFITIDNKKCEFTNAKFDNTIDLGLINLFKMGKKKSNKISFIINFSQIAEIESNGLKTFKTVENLKTSKLKRYHYLSKKNIIAYKTTGDRFFEIKVKQAPLAKIPCSSDDCSIEIKFFNDVFGYLKKNKKKFKEI